jgi:hypothetical protein
VTSNKESQLDLVALHSAGATVRHRSPFAELDVPVLSPGSDAEFMRKWVVPIYMDWLVTPDTLISALRPLWSEVTPELVSTLLANFNWRPRIVGAWLAAIAPHPELDDHIGRLLVRSDACDAGKGYCLALTAFNTPASRDYLRRYLDYYLTQPQLYFDQGEALSAVAYLDEINGTNDAATYATSWEAFVKNKPNWDLQRTETRFRKQLVTLREVNRALGRRVAG